MSVRMTAYAAADRVAALGTSKAITWVENNILNFVIIIVGIGVIAGAKRKNHKGALMEFGIMLIGLVIVGIGVTNGAAVTTGKTLWGLLA